MLDKRIFKLVPEALRPAVISVGLRLLALVCRVCALMCVACMLGAVLGGEDAAAAGRVSASSFMLVGVLCGLGFFAFESVAGKFATRAASLVKQRVRADVYEALLYLGGSNHAGIDEKRVFQVLGEGTEKLGAYAGRYVPQLMYAALAPLALFAGMIPICLPAAFVLVACVPLIPVSIACFMKGAKRIMAQHWASHVDLGAEFLDAVRGLSTLVAFRADGRAHAKLDERAEEVRRATMRLLRVQLNSVTLMDVVAYGGSAAGIACGLVLYAADGLAMWQLAAVALLSLEFFLPMRTLGSYFHTGMAAVPVLDDAERVLEMRRPMRGDLTVPCGETDIVCEGLSFSFGPDAFCLHGIDLTVENGSYVGITGMSGSGKSTLARLICGRLAGYEGSVRVGGVELRDLAPDALRETVTYVGPSSHVFRGSVRSNLRLGAPQASDAQMWEALRRCKLQHEVLEWGGLDAEVAEGGSNISGGQRQRLCLARAFLHDSAVYLFDEATSAVDADSERDILAFIQELALEKTVVVVSHRLATLKWTDEIYVLDEGRVVQRGSHAELLRQTGRYAQLWEQQAELEHFSQAMQSGAVRANQKVAPGPVITPGEQRALDLMPDSVAQIMRMAIDNKPVREAISGASPSAGHPSWIPRGLGAHAPQGIDAAPDGVGDDACAEEAGTCTPAERPRCRALRVVRGLVGATRAQMPALAAAVACGVGASVCAAGVLALGLAWAAGLMPGGLGAGPACVACALATCALLRGLLSYAERLGMHDQAFRTLSNIRSQVFGSLRRLAPAKLERRDAGDLVALLTSDVEVLESFYARSLAPVAASLVGAGVLTAAASVLAPGLAPFGIAAVVLLGVAVPFAVNRALEEDGRTMCEEALAMSAFMLDGLLGMGELLQYGGAAARTEQTRERLAAAACDEEAFACRSAWLASVGPAVSLMCIVGGAALAYGADMGPAAGVAAVALCSAFGCLERLSALASGFHRVLAAGSRILDVLDEEAVIPRVEGGLPLGDFTGAALCNVDFSYGDVVALRQANVAFEPGQVVALSGPSGSGKTTVLKLLMRVWDADAGRVELCGRDVRGVPTDELRACEGCMEQRTYLFSGTLRDNITLVRPNASAEELAYAVEQANLSDFVASLPEGLDTRVGTGGEDVSDGERQRVGLARLFLYDAPLNLLDEPTSNLDTVNEAAVLKAIDAQRAGKTFVIVSHRASVSSIADVVYRMG